MARIIQHSFNGKFPKRKGTSTGMYTFCTKCGLILLKNVASKKAANKPCESEWNEDYIDVRKINWIK